jgi:uncharacterized protein (DUF433 family)
VATPDLARLDNAKLTISEAEAVTGVARVHINRILDDGHFADIWKIELQDGRRLLNLDHCVFVRFHEDSGRLLAPQARKDLWFKYREKIIPHKATHEFFITNFVLTLGNSVCVDMTKHYRAVHNCWEALLRSKTEIVTDPGIRGGVPVISGTRIGAHEVAGVFEKAGVEEALAIYPALDAEKVEAAVMYARAHPRVGRPARNEASPSGKGRLASSRTVRRKSA